MANSPEKLDKSKLRLLYADVLRGYSVAENFFIKHLSSFDYAEIDIKNNYYSDLAKENNLPTEKEKLDFLIEHALWNPEKDSQILQFENFIDRAEETKKTRWRKNEIEGIARQIEEHRQKRDVLVKEKAELLEETVESFASRKTSEFYILFSFFKDKNFTVPLYKEEEFDDLTDSQITELVEIYNKKTKYINSLNIQRIALSGFFLNQLSICKNNPFVFYGKPVINLTHYQVELFSQGLFFKNILSESEIKPTEEILDDPPRLVDIYYGRKNLEKETGKHAGKDGNVSITASKTDLEYLGVNTQQPPNQISKIQAFMKKTGKNSLSREEIIQNKLM